MTSEENNEKNINQNLQNEKEERLIAIVAASTAIIIIAAGIILIPFPQLPNTLETNSPIQSITGIIKTINYHQEIEDYACCNITTIINFSDDKQLILPNLNLIDNDDYKLIGKNITAYYKTQANGANTLLTITRNDLTTSRDGKIWAKNP